MNMEGYNDSQNTLTQSNQANFMNIFFSTRHRGTFTDTSLNRGGRNFKISQSKLWINSFTLHKEWLFGWKWIRKSKPKTTSETTSFTRLHLWKTEELREKMLLLITFISASKESENVKRKKNVAAMWSQQLFLLMKHAQYSFKFSISVRGKRVTFFEKNLSFSQFFGIDSCWDVVLFNHRYVNTKKSAENWNKLIWFLHKISTMKNTWKSILEIIFKFSIPIQYNKFNCIHSSSYFSKHQNLIFYVNSMRIIEHGENKFFSFKIYAPFIFLHPYLIK
jgi:hypothetical protein